MKKIFKKLIINF